MIAVTSTKILVIYKFHYINTQMHIFIIKYIKLNIQIIYKRCLMRYLHNLMNSDIFK